MTIDEILADIMTYSDTKYMLFYTGFAHHATITRDTDGDKIEIARRSPYSALEAITEAHAAFTKVVNQGYPPFVLHTNLIEGQVNATSDGISSNAYDPYDPN